MAELGGVRRKAGTTRQRPGAGAGAGAGGKGRGLIEPHASWRAGSPTPTARGGGDLADTAGSRSVLELWPGSTLLLLLLLLLLLPTSRQLHMALISGLSPVPVLAPAISLEIWRDGSRCAMVATLRARQVLRLTVGRNMRITLATVCPPRSAPPPPRDVHCNCSNCTNCTRRLTLLRLPLLQQQQQQVQCRKRCRNMRNGLLA